MDNSFSNNIKKRLYNIVRNYVKVRLTGNLGRVIEDNEKLTCYVDKNKCEKKDYRYTIPCHGIRESDKELAEAYKLNKPILYVIEGLEFERRTSIFGYNNCIVDIKDCKFNCGLTCYINGKCTLDDVFIGGLGYLDISASEMIIKNINIISFCICIGADKKLDILDSIIEAKWKTSVHLHSVDELNLVNSKIAGSCINCKSKSIISDTDSSFTASDKVNITTDSFNQITITSPSIIYNGRIFTNGDKSITLEKLLDPLRIKQLELVTLLRQIKNECGKANSEKIDEYKSTLNNQAITKVLKKSSKDDF